MESQERFACFHYGFSLECLQMWGDQCLGTCMAETVVPNEMRTGWSTICLLPGDYTQLTCSLDSWLLGRILELSAGSDPNRSAFANTSLCSRLSMLVFFFFFLIFLFSYFLFSYFFIFFFIYLFFSLFPMEHPCFPGIQGGFLHSFSQTV